VVAVVSQNGVGAVEVQFHAFLTSTVHIRKWSEARSSFLASCSKIYLSQYFDSMDSRTGLQERKILSPPIICPLFSSKQSLTF